ncbi:MAG: flotillin-like FloA family protein [Verrucomicrobiota bacterium]
MMGNALIILAIIIAALLLIVGFVLATFLPLWINAKASGLNVTIPEMMLMKIRRVDPRRIVNAMITLTKSGIDISAKDVETFYLTGGNLGAVTEAAIAADKAGLEIDFHRMAAIDLAGRDVVDAVESRVNPKVLQCPAIEDRMDTITGVCQDGIRIGATARITVRTELRNLVGGAGAETIVARVGEGIVAAIGNAKSHKDILENPDRISNYLLEHGLDSGTCFEILSVDVGDIDVKDNVGAYLQSVQADSDKRIAQAKAEVRRAAAVAEEREMVARTVDSRSRVVEAKSVQPLAEASAVEESNFGSPRPVIYSLHDRMRWL